MDKKICIDCEEMLELSQFELRRDTGKYRNQCKQCRQKKINEFRRTNDEYKDRYNIYRSERYQNDVEYALKERLRARLRKALRSQDATKCHKTIELLGCTLETFKSYLESQFTNGMSWQNRNFDIDHKIPCSYFDLTDPEQVKKCFHYTNLQPLSPSENLKKSNKLYPEYFNESS